MHFGCDVKKVMVEELAEEADLEKVRAKDESTERS
jgi:hypothetical protein